MEKLDELVELAKELNGEKWRYTRTSNFSNGYITGKDGRTIVETYSGDVPANACRFIEMADPETILAIAEAFRAMAHGQCGGALLEREEHHVAVVGELLKRNAELEQRAEAAEAKASNLNDGWLNAINERDEARAKLAEYENQASVPAAFMVERNAGDILYPSKCRRQAEWDAKNLNGNFYELFMRPAPAASLAELVPDEFTNDEVPCAMTDVIQAEMDGWNACRAAIMRNIEEGE